MAPACSVAAREPFLWQSRGMQQAVYAIGWLSPEAGRVHRKENYFSIFQFYINGLMSMRFILILYRYSYYGPKGTVQYIFEEFF